jgi:hypothetical protein
MKCIICEKNANATGSHMVPANLIKNCIGESDAEESYEIDAKKAKVDVYYGRDNLKNKSTKIKKSHYKEDNVLCQSCEDKLADLESLFYTEFLSKFRIERFKQNFTYSLLSTGFEILNPKRISNIQIQVYTYSIVFRYCRNNELLDGTKFLNEKELLKIKEFLNLYLYDSQDECKEFISDFNLVLTFDKTSNKGSFISSASDFKNPYRFYFCELIVELYTSKVSKEKEKLFQNSINNINQEFANIIIGPAEHYLKLFTEMGKILASEYITNGVKLLCELNGKNYQTNLNEFGKLMSFYQSKGLPNATDKALEELREKYSG